MLNAKTIFTAQRCNNIINLFSFSGAVEFIDITHFHYKTSAEQISKVF